MNGLHVWSRWLGALFLALAITALGACGGDREEPLRVGMIPDAGATQVSVADKAPLQRYLAEKLGRPVELVIPTNYNATVEALGNGSLDVAYLGGLTYVKAHELYGAVPLVQRDIDRRFHSVFIAGAESEIASLDDLAGKTFCFGDINSTSGHLMPRLALMEAGLDPASDLSQFRHTGAHSATAEAVASGACDAGALDETVYRSLVEEGHIEPAAVTVFHTSEPFTDYVWAAREDLGAEDRQDIADAFLDLTKGRDDAVLAILRGERFVPASNDAYADVKRIASELDLL